MLSTCIRSLHRLSVGGPAARSPTVLAAVSPMLMQLNRQQPLHTTGRNEAARKGTREKARKKKVKVEVKKVGFIPHNQRGKDRLNLLLRDKHIDDTWKQLPTDNVWVGRYYRWRTYTVAEAIECHRETQHPTMYGHPDAPLLIDIELNMQGEKATRFVDNFQRMAMIEHRFDHGEERQILVLAKGEDQLKAAQEAGAALVGGPDLIKNIQSGDVKLPDYQFVVAHPNIMAELVAVRGLLKRKFPNPKNGTLGTNLVEMVQQYLNGIQYSATKDEHQQNYGIIRTCVGRLSMPTEQLEANVAALLRDVNVIRPRREGRFVTRVLLRTTPSREQLKIDPFVYIPEGGKSRKASLLEAEEAAEAEEAEEVAEEEAQQKKATN